VLLVSFLVVVRLLLVNLHEIVINSHGALARGCFLSSSYASHGQNACGFFIFSLPSPIRASKDEAGQAMG
jgi:hypothetical protein